MPHLIDRLRTAATSAKGPVKALLTEAARAIEGTYSLCVTRDALIDLRDARIANLTELLAMRDADLADQDGQIALLRREIDLRISMARRDRADRADLRAS